MLGFLRISLKTIVISFLLLTLLQGCHIPLIYLYNAGNSQKDVSSDFKRGHVVGKEYELLQDVYLTQLRFCEELSLDKSRMRSYTWENGKEVELNPFALFNTVPKGTKFRVCSVLVKTNYGNELWSQSILANFIDENGNILFQANSCGKIVPVRVTFLFQNTSQMPNEDWIFHPMSEWIKEVDSS